MKKNWNLLICGMLSFATYAQEKGYTLTLTDKDKKLEISSGTLSLKVIGYSGKDIIITSQTGDVVLPDEAKGLKQVVGGFIENTGVGANVSRKEGIVKIKIPKSEFYESFVIKVPQNMDLKLREFHNNYCSWFITDMKGEVEAKSTYSSITVDKVTGPLMVYSTWGMVKVVYEKLNQEKPNAIFSNKEVHVTLPADTKANLALNSTWGSVFTDFDIVANEDEEDDEDEPKVKISKSISNKSANKANLTPPSPVSKTQSEDDASFARPTGVTISPKENKSTWVGTNTTYENFDVGIEEEKDLGTINGGGVKLSLRSNHGMIYLKKKK